MLHAGLRWCHSGKFGSLRLPTSSDLCTFSQRGKSKIIKMFIQKRYVLKGIGTNDKESAGLDTGVGGHHVNVNGRNTTTDALARTIERVNGK